jgi:hypothetical protein
MSDTEESKNFEPAEEQQLNGVPRESQALDDALLRNRLIGVA